MSVILGIIAQASMMVYGFAYLVPTSKKELCGPQGKPPGSGGMAFGRFVWQLLSAAEYGMRLSSASLRLLRTSLYQNSYPTLNDLPNHEHISDEIDVKELADVASVTKTYFIRLFRKVAGITPLEYRRLFLQQ